MIVRRLLLAALLVGCGSAPSPEPVAAEAPDPCSRAARQGDGSFFEAEDGTEVWYRVAGPADAPTIVYLHGGPGYNAYAFERTAGARLEQRYRMLYVDQRGAGRSTFDGAPERYGMAPTVADLEALREHVGAERFVLLGHSFGAIVAAAYAHRHPDHVAAVVQVDSAPEVGRALEHQVQTLDAAAETELAEQANEVHAIASRDAPAFDRLGELYGLLGRLPVQRQLHYASADAQERMEVLDAEPGILGCTSSEVVGAFAREGYLGDVPEHVSEPIGAPTLLLAGRASHVIGEENITQAAEQWGAQVVWIEDAGHFVYFEQPEAFVRAVTEFLDGALTP